MLFPSHYKAYNLVLLFLLSFRPQAVNSSSTPSDGTNPTPPISPADNHSSRQNKKLSSFPDTCPSDPETFQTMENLFKKGSFKESLNSLADLLPNMLFGGQGGRAPEQTDHIAVIEEGSDEELLTQIDETKPPRFRASPNKSDDECRLIIIQITDVYTLESLASFKTLVEEVRATAHGATVVCVLTGDFLSPYLLSTVDHGFGMMNALNSIPLDYIIWGNHEADIDHKIQCRHVQQFRGKWINSNMLDHEAMAYQQEYDIITLESLNGQHSRKVGLCAVLSDDPNLYKQFKSPGAFGGATISDPWEALRKYKTILEDEQGCDLVIPLEHLYVPDDHKTCEQFDFPLILSGHDHHKVDEIYCGTRLIKPGQNADYSAVVEVTWKNNGDRNEKPTIKSRFVRTRDWVADPLCEKQNLKAYDALAPLRNTELAQIPPELEPITSNGARSSVCSMGQYICTLLRKALNSRTKSRDYKIDAVLLMGGNIRGNMDYPSGSYFSLEALEAEIKSNEVVATVDMPGWLLEEGILATHAGDPIPGWFQYDSGVIEDDTEKKITHVGGEPLDKDRIYKVATKISDLTNGQSPPLKEYYDAHPEALPPKGNYINIQSELLSYFAKSLWKKLWIAIAEELVKEELSLSRNGGSVSIQEEPGEHPLKATSNDGAVGAFGTSYQSQKSLHSRGTSSSMQSPGGGVGMSVPIAIPVSHGHPSQKSLHSRTPSQSSSGVHGSSFGNNLGMLGTSYQSQKSLHSRTPSQTGTGSGMHSRTPSVSSFDVMQALDQTGSGSITVGELQIALHKMLGMQIDKREQTLAKFIHDYADVTGNGKVTMTDIEHFASALTEDGFLTVSDGTKVLILPEGMEVGNNAVVDDDDESELGLDMDD